MALKAGSSEVGSAAALAHTGSVAGNDAVVDAALRQLNVIRVTSIEELLTTAAVLGYSRWPRGRRMGAVTTSGGACDIIADRASAEGIELPAFSGPTAAAITEHLPPFAEVRNPLDVTGYFLANRRTAALTPVDAALAHAVADPGLDFVLYSGLSVPDAKPEEAAAAVLEERVAWLAGQLDVGPDPGHRHDLDLRRPVRLRPRTAWPARRAPAGRHRPRDPRDREFAALARATRSAHARTFCCTARSYADQPYRTLAGVRG